MIWLKICLYAICAVIFLFAVYEILKNSEYFASALRGNVPFVSCPRPLRAAIVRTINAHYGDAKTLCDIGSGYGGLMRHIVRRCPVCATGLENMPISAVGAKMMSAITCGGRVRTIWCDAFEYLDGCDGFDIGIAYLGPGVNDKLARYIPKFRVLIVLDVPIGGVTPTRTIDVGHGHTHYGRKKYPHKLFIYER